MNDAAVTINVLANTSQANASLAGVSANMRTAGTTASASASRFTKAGHEIHTAANGLQYWIDKQGKARTEAGKFVSALDKQAAGIGNVGNAARKAGADIGNGSGGLGFSIASLLKPLAAATAAYLSFRTAMAIGKDIVQTSADFEQSMATVKAVSMSAADYTEENFKAMQDEARRLGAVTVFSSVEAADALKFLAQGGLSCTQATAALADTLNLAQAGGLELADAAEISTIVLNGMGADVSELGNIVDVLAFTANSTATDVRQLSMAFKFVAPMAAAAGKGVEEMAAAIGVLSSNGIQGDMAGTALRGMMSQLANTSSMASKKLRAMGVDMESVNPKTKTLTEIMKALKDKGVDGMNAFTIFGPHAGNAVSVLTQKMQDLEKQTQRTLVEAPGSAAKVAAVMNMTFSGAVERMSSAWDELKLTLGDAGIMDALSGAVQWFTGIIDQCTQAVKVLSMAFKGGDIGKMFMLTLQTGAMAAVNYMAGLLSLMFKLVVTEFFARLQLIMDPNFWMGLFNVFVALGSLLNSIIFKVAADLAESARPFISAVFQGLMFIGDKFKSAFVIVATTFVDLILAGIEKIMPAIAKIGEILGMDFEGAAESLKDARESNTQSREEAMGTIQRSLGSYSEDAASATSGLITGLNDVSKQQAGQMKTAWSEGSGQLGGAVMNDLVTPIMDELKGFKPLDVFDASKQQGELDALWNKNAALVPKSKEPEKNAKGNKEADKDGAKKTASSDDKVGDVVTDSLQAIGGGGFASASGGKDVVSETARGANATEKVAENTAFIASNIGRVSSTDISKANTPIIGNAGLGTDRQISLLTGIKGVLEDIRKAMGQGKIIVSTT